MGLLNLFHTKRITDKVFGAIEYRVFLFGENYWKGVVAFEPVGHEIQLTLGGDRSGPNQTQRKFFLELLDHYEGHSEDYFRYLYETFIMANGEGLPSEVADSDNLKEESALVSIYIPRFEEPNDEWTLCYSGYWGEHICLFFHDWTFSYGFYDC